MDGATKEILQDLGASTAVLQDCIAKLEYSRVNLSDAKTGMVEILKTAEILAQEQLTIIRSILQGRRISTHHYEET